MSLGKHTKCDLSAGIAKIDLEKLTKQIMIHFYSMVNDIRQKTSDLQNNLTEEDRKKSVSSMSSTGADNLISLAKNLGETTELLHTLYEVSGREIEIVRPETTE